MGRVNLERCEGDGSKYDHNDVIEIFKELMNEVKNYSGWVKWQLLVYFQAPAPWFNKNL